METDITLRSSRRIILIDAKFYNEALASRHGVQKIRSNHLYQFYSYLEHAGLRTPGVPVDGALIYPAVGEPVALHYRLRGHEVVVRAIDLMRPWREIHDELLAILGQFWHYATGSNCSSVTVSASGRPGRILQLPYRQR